MNVRIVFFLIRDHLASSLPYSWSSGQLPPLLVNLSKLASVTRDSINSSLLLVIVWTVAFLTRDLVVSLTHEPVKVPSLIRGLE